MKANLRAPLLAGLIVLLGLAAGCTVRPLLATQPADPGGSETARLSSVAVAPVETRYGQEVRNHLIFLLNGGAGTPADPRYTLDLTVTRSIASAAQIQSGGLDEPTAGIMVMTGAYLLKDDASGQVLASGQQQVSASFDRPRQEFAILRAERDAEDRAARELAELLRLTLAQDMVRLDAN